MSRTLSDSRLVIRTLSEFRGGQGVCREPVSEGIVPGRNEMGLAETKPVAKRG
ncbi:hypothetical protein [Paenibacillus phytorum]|uniref:hypothetical protein n=1 Tax=Paenibacillus phytorum TaxID=2654977 RepID=UPI001492D827|nr:hypothetical protein [Paenibacillus phytorum]